MQAPFRIGLMTVLIPRNLDLVTALDFVSQLRQLTNPERLIFDGGEMRHVEPFAMAVVAREIRLTLIRFSNIPLFHRNLNNEYARFMVFFRFPVSIILIIKL